MEKIIVTTLSPEQLETVIFLAVSRALKMQGLAIVEKPDKPKKEKSSRVKKEEVSHA